MMINKNDLLPTSEFICDLERIIEYEKRAKHIEFGEFLTIDEVIEELMRLKEVVGGSTTVHLLDTDEQDSQLDDVPYVPLGIKYGKEIKHINGVTASLVISRTKDYYRAMEKIK